MKATVRNFALIVLMSSLFACGSDNDPSPGGGDGDLGTFVGNIQVVDDPQTELGYILNAKVTLTKNGSKATVKVTGDPGFDREYTGTVTSFATGIYSFTLDKQTKPTAKIAGESAQIADNKLTIKLDVAGDKITVRDSPGTTTTRDIEGKISMIGSNMLRQ